jgi:hypothetical protein
MMCNNPFKATDILHCPKCGFMILCADMRVTGNIAGSAEVTAHCSHCGIDVFFGYVDIWNHCSKRKARKGKR